MWTVYDHLFSSIFWVTGTVGIVLNTYLIYLIFFHAPETLKVYRVFLANATIADLIFAISTTFAQIRSAALQRSVEFDFLLGNMYSHAVQRLATISDVDF